MFEDGYRFVAEGQHASAHRQRKCLMPRRPVEHKAVAAADG
jgi:hypothetical protein